MFKGENTTSVFILIAINILLWNAESLAQPLSDGPTVGGRQAQCSITFKGQASGGTFIFYQYLGGKSKCAIVETTAGEPAAKVVERIADIIEERNPFGWIIVRGGNNKNEQRVASSVGGELSFAGSCGVYLIAGTETGLGIPQPPHSLTANYDPDTNTITFRWVNPSPNAYDSIKILCRRSYSDILSGNSESYVFDLNKYLSNMQKDIEVYNNLIKARGAHLDLPSDLLGDLDFWVFGEKNDIPSNGAAIRVDRNRQEELFGIPFTSGIAPNWQSWSVDNNEKKIIVKEVKKEGNTNVSDHQDNSVGIFDVYSFYQVINTDSRGGTGGVYRKFIGLTPGHTYRITTRVATLSEPNEPQWSVSVHAAPNGPDGRNLSPRQMAGLDVLPSGNKGLAAGRIGLYDSSLTTKGRFEEISTNKIKTVRGCEISDITLPAGVDSITVWVRCSASSAVSAALDWISLEDLSVQKL